MGVASQFYTPVCDNKVPSLVASLFSWRCLAASTSSFLHAAINLRPPSVTVSTHTNVQYNGGLLPDIILLSSTVLFPSGNPFKCHQEILYLQPLIPPKRFDIFPPPNWGMLRRSRCVCVFSSHPFWTSSSLDVPAGVTQEEGHTGFLIHLPSAVRALIFVARRIQPFLSLVDREVEFCVLTN